MQGSLSEIDTRSILELIEIGQKTGTLLIETSSAPSVAARPLGPLPPPRPQSWLIFVRSGRILYAIDPHHNVSCLQNYLRFYKLESAFNSIEALSGSAMSIPEYGYLWSLLARNLLSPAQGRQILYSMVQEVLFDLMRLHQGSFSFSSGCDAIPPADHV
ncbi:DUF4388 domain-containing protein [Neosynechococcus sphagnicola]|uniref:DUF4388 domain-containing protein n=1 Tax=Neosynechococcus sphagnicola TaxID=1501145 RepID=UPI0009079767|nr:DUF4388 domain-containing protein [Neosynechococcus sphagnicola]